MKNLMLVLFSLVVVGVSTPSMMAQCRPAYHPTYTHSTTMGWRHHFSCNELLAVQYDNAGIVGGQHQMGDVLNAQAHLEQAIVHGDVWGGGGVLSGPGAGGVSPLEIGMAGGILGGAFGGLKGAAIGGVGGYLGTKAVKAAINKHRQSDGSGGNRPYFGQGRDGQFELTNATTAPLDVFDGRKFVGHMQAGEVRQVPPPKDRYRAEALVPNSRGGISKGGLETVATENGWIFIKPASARVGR